MEAGKKFDIPVIGTTWKNKKVKEYRAVELLEKFISGGNRCTSFLSAEQVRNYRENALNQFGINTKEKAILKNITLTYQRIYGI